MLQNEMSQEVDCASFGGVNGLNRLLLYFLIVILNPIWMLSSTKKHFSQFFAQNVFILFNEIHLHFKC